MLINLVFDTKKVIYLRNINSTQINNIRDSFNAIYQSTCLLYCNDVNGGNHLKL